MKLPSRQEAKLIWYKGPIAMVLTRKNHVRLRKIEPMRNFHANEFGIFELDTETEYRYNKQSVSFYISHGTHIPKKTLKQIYELYYNRDYLRLKKILDGLYPELANKPHATIFQYFKHIVDYTKHHAIDIDTEKFLPHFTAYNPISIKMANEVSWNSKKAIESLNAKFNPPISLGVAVLVGLIGMAVAQNWTNWIEQARESMGGLLG